ncbi:hypothetical protein KY289_003122 [Solanum tuberosum]|nr:hypothetical protein KY289_003122 [Solanum tuberosum]
MEKKKMNAVAAMAIVLMILLSSNTVRVAAQGVNCYDSCNTACRESTNVVMKSVGLGADQMAKLIQTWVESAEMYRGYYIL